MFVFSCLMKILSVHGCIHIRVCALVNPHEFFFHLHSNTEVVLIKQHILSAWYLLHHFISFLLQHLKILLTLDNTHLSSHSFCGQEAGLGFAGSTAQGLERLQSRCFPGLESCQRLMWFLPPETVYFLMVVKFMKPCFFWTKRRVSNF